MGSSPVTATTPLQGALERCLREHDASGSPGSPGRGEPIIAAFSGGPDSLALLLVLRRLAPALWVRPVAAHVDHRLDAGSPARAESARQLAAWLGMPFRLLAGDAAGEARGEGREAAARRLRYRLLDELRRELGARWVLTAHHADDQAETVLLRLAHGSGLAGLAGMAVQNRHVLRPFLSLSRRDLRAAVAASGLSPLEDPTNQDLSLARNRLRHVLLPALGSDAATGARRLAAAATALTAGVERRLMELLPSLADGPEHAGPPRVPLAALRRLPGELLPWALALLHKRSGVEYPPRAVAVAELRRQLYRSDRVHCDCGGGWRWRTDKAGRLRVEPANGAPPFTYTADRAALTAQTR